MAYSSGFSPHPRISYANAAPTGSASEAEYLEIGLAKVLEPEEVLASLNPAMPQGLRILAARTALGALAPQLRASLWQITGEPVVARDWLGLLEADALPYEKQTKRGVRTRDLRPAIKSITVETGTINLMLEHLEPQVRPDGIWHLVTGNTDCLLTRARQGQLGSGEVKNLF